MVKEFWKSISISQSYRQKYSGTFFPDTVYIAHELVDNALVLANLREYRHKWYIAKKLDSLDYIIVADSMGLCSTTLT